MTEKRIAKFSQDQVEGFIAKFDKQIATMVRAARKRLKRAFFPTAVELVYDNYNALAIGWGPNERASEVVVSLAVYASGVNLYFIQGAKLADPAGLLQGNGKQGRFVRLTDLAVLDDHRIQRLIEAAMAMGKTKLPANGEGYTVVKSLSAKQRPRKSGSVGLRRVREI